MRRDFGIIVLLVLVGLATVLGLDIKSDQEPDDQNLFQFVRIRYHGFTAGRWGREPPWAHDYPRAERNFLKILSEVTSIETTPESFRVMEFTDPEIQSYPFLYISEPGYWDVTEEEVENLREYLNKGGFLLFDDFGGQWEWNNLVQTMRQVLPDRHFEELEPSNPIFHCFYDIEDLYLQPPYQLQQRGEPSWQGIFDENGRLLVVACLNNDIGDHWEWSDESYTPISLSNEAYKFGINFVIYALTH